MAEQGGTLYLEADEEITSAIDKLSALDAAEVSIVVPKRSTLLQSLVNLKLLKKAAQDSKKQLILVTNDRTATHLAGRVGLAVAATLGAEASVPQATQAAPVAASEILEDDTEPAAASQMAEPVAAAPVMTKRSLAAEPIKASKAKTAKMPDFNRFQKRLLWGGAALLLVLILTAANYFFKSATVTLFVRGEKVATDFDFTVDTAGKSDYDAAIVEGKKVEVEHTLSTKFSATGKKDVGTKAGGQMTVYNNYDESPRTYPAGARFIAPDAKVFRANSDFTVPGADASVVGGKVVLTPGTVKVAVTADQAGDQYNLGPTKYSMPGQPSEIYGQGQQMSGGTSKQVTVVTQGDIDGAKNQALEEDESDAKQDVKKKAGKDHRLIEPSWKANVVSADSNPAVDQEASQATLTIKVIYSQLAVAEKDFVDMVENQQLKMIGEQNQVYDNGLEKAEITALEGKEDQFALSTEAYGGAKIDLKQTTKELSGQRFGDAVSEAEKLPGVKKVEIVVRPSWSSKLPRRAENIKIDIEVEDSGS